MGLKKLKQKRWFRILSNKYVLILLFFGAWMLFLDSNSWLVHHELNQAIDKLKSEKSFYSKKITHDSSLLKQLRSPEGLKRYAREKYHMKRKNEAVYIIQFQDSLKTD